MPEARAPYDFTLNPSLQVTRLGVGREDEPVLIIDDVLGKPRDLVEFAASEVQFEPAWTASGGYPGLRAAAPLGYVEGLIRRLAPVLENAWGLERFRLARADCTLSLVTVPPDRLAPMQRIPHIDTVDPLRIALLHYLFEGDFGGTAFYRHRATGLETISPRQEPAYLRARDRELQAQPPAPGYLYGDTACYRKTDQVEARFNRVVVYRSCLLHCGQISAAMNFSPDPRQGRLTANVFATYSPAS